MHDARISRLVKKIFAGFERTLVMRVMPQDKSIRTVDHSCRFQLGGDVPGGESGRSITNFCPLGVTGNKMAQASQPPAATTSSRTRVKKARKVL